MRRRVLGALRLDGVLELEDGAEASGVPHGVRVDLERLARGLVRA